jgi:imidazolonepropionase
MALRVYRRFSQIATLKKALIKDGRFLAPEDLSIIENASIVFDDTSILWIGEDSHLPAKYFSLPSVSFEGHCAVPEIVDSHTHLVFGGDRSHEYFMRLCGTTYEALASKGGGILSTVKSTKSLSKEDMLVLAGQRIEKMYRLGIGTIEIKSGYGLDMEKEYELSCVINELKSLYAHKVRIQNTFMAAHAVPQGMTSSFYMKTVVLPLLNRLASQHSIDAVDIFHENGYFSTADVEELFRAAIKVGIPVKAHVDEFADNGGAALVTKFHALSAEHLLHTGDEGIQALASSKTVAVLLPGTAFFLGKQHANARKFFDAGVKVAIGSDYNPGSCHWGNVLAIASMAAPLYHMNPAELWSSITLNAAHALGLSDQGALLEGMSPRLSIFKTDKIEKITYSWGENLSANA